MGGKGSAPPPPDYVGAAQQQAAASKEVTNMQNFANRPTQNTPWGTTSWQTSADVDPATGQAVTRWTQNTQLTPELQAALNEQVNLQRDRSQLAGNFMDRVRGEYGQPFDWSSLPQRQSMTGPASLSTQVGRENVQRGLNFGDNPALPQFDSSYRDKVAQSLMERMQPVHERQQQQMETQLANQGFTVGSEGYTRALADLQQRQAAERYNALDTAGNEAQRLFSMGMGARQQATQEDIAGGQFANAAAQQAFGQGLSAQQFGNQALAQQQALQQNYANFQNALRQQALAEQMQRRGMSLNEMNALLTGQQVQMPQMPSFNAAGRAETPNILGATQAGYDAQLGAYNAQQAAGSNMLGGLFSLGASAMMPGAGSLFGFGR